MRMFCFDLIQNGDLVSSTTQSSLSTSAVVEIKALAILFCTCTATSLWPPTHLSLSTLTRI